jgi:hypothetical protein
MSCGQPRTLIRGCIVTGAIAATVARRGPSGRKWAQGPHRVAMAAIVGLGVDVRSGSGAWVGRYCVACVALVQGSHVCRAVTSTWLAPVRVTRELTCGERQVY